jgi:hypothetical protein
LDNQANLQNLVHLLIHSRGELVILVNFQCSAILSGCLPVVALFPGSGCLMYVIGGCGFVIVAVMVGFSMAGGHVGALLHLS